MNKQHKMLKSVWEAYLETFLTEVECEDMNHCPLFTFPEYAYVYKGLAISDSRPPSWCDGVNIPLPDEEDPEFEEILENMPPDPFITCRQKYSKKCLLRCWKQVAFLNFKKIIDMEGYM